MPIDRRPPQRTERSGGQNKKLKAKKTGQRPVFYSGPALLGSRRFRLATLEWRHAVLADQRQVVGLRPVGDLALGRRLGAGLFLVALGVDFFLLHAHGLARRLDLLRPGVGAFDFLDSAALERLLEVALDARHQVPVTVADQ